MAETDMSMINSESLEGDLVVAGVYGTEHEAAEHGLVVLAAGYPYWLLEDAVGVQLLIERDAVANARFHLEAYDRESRDWPPPPITDPWLSRKIDLLTPMCWAAVVLVLFNLSSQSPEWIEHGSLQPKAIFQDGEWWRVVTALFLHADAAHVISNALSGLLVFAAVASTFGRVSGWLLVLFAAILGNIAVAAASASSEYSSVGASTAIFAGIGLLTGRSIRVAWRSKHPYRWRAMFAPFAAGATVLALYGAGGQRVDVGAHLTGFTAGLALGFLAAFVRTGKTMREN